MEKITTIPTGTKVGDMVSLGRLPTATMDHQIAGYSSMFVTDSQDIAATLEYTDMAEADNTEVTGIMAYAKDGDFVEIWATTASAHYMIHAPYTRII